MLVALWVGFGAVEWHQAQQATRRRHHVAHAEGAEHPPPYSIKAHHIERGAYPRSIARVHDLPCQFKRENQGGGGEELVFVKPEIFASDLGWWLCRCNGDLARSL